MIWSFTNCKHEYYAVVLLQLHTWQCATYIRKSLKRVSPNAGRAFSVRQCSSEKRILPQNTQFVRLLYPSTNLCLRCDSAWCLEFGVTWRNVSLMLQRSRISTMVSSHSPESAYMYEIIVHFDRGLRRCISTEIIRLYAFI